MEGCKISKKETYMIIGVSLSLLGICISFGFSLFFGFWGSVLFSSYVLLKKGFSAHRLINMVFSGLKECKILYGVVLLIGATVSIWLSSGLVPAIMYYGFDYMKGMNFVFATFVITSILSVFMGTAVGTISTIGIALLGIGKGFGIPGHILLGTIVSGAFIADKFSPISGLLSLTLSMTKTKYKETAKSMIRTLLPIYFITGWIYYFIGNKYAIDIDFTRLDDFNRAISDGFFISPFMLIFPIVILILSMLGIESISTISIGLVGGMILSFTLQKMSMLNILKAIFFGYEGTTSSNELNQIFHSGGIVSMLEVVFIIMGAVALSSIFEGTKLMDPFIDKLLHHVQSKGQLIAKTSMMSSILTIVTCDQTSGVVLTGKLLRGKYKELGVDHTILARTISDTGTIIAPLMPWNINAIIIFVITGISAMAYAPYAVLCYVSPLITFIIALRFKGTGNMKNV